MVGVAISARDVEHFIAEKMEDILTRQQSQSDDELERKEKEEEERRLTEIRKRAVRGRERSGT